MTTFILSHNLQVHSQEVPAFLLEELAAGIQSNAATIASANVIDHPHWILSLTSDSSPSDMAKDLVVAWKKLRSQLGHDSNHTVLALGGRKDSEATPGAPLQQGFWGVDVVETQDEKTFLQAINWDVLKASRPADGVFEISSNS